MTSEGSEARGQGAGAKAARWSRYAGPAVVLLAAAVAIGPELVKGNSCGHDFDFHLVSWLDAHNSWQQGIAYPHWTPSANYGAGEPRFVFYPPLTWMLGAALGFVLPWTAVPILLTFLLLAGTGLASRALARLALDDCWATLAGCAALFSGYALFTAYERTAFAELAGGFWIPLALLYIFREGNRTGGLLKRAFDGSAVPLALAVAGAWLSNPTVGVMASYSLASVALVVGLLSRSWAPIVRAMVAAALGMGLTAIYLVPAAWEQRWVDIHQVTNDPGQTVENNWLFAHHADPSLALHDAVLHTASAIAVLMIAVALACVLVSWLRGRLPGERRTWIPLALIPVVILFLLFPVSRPVWNLLPELRFLQFPWRWLIVLEAPMAIFLATAVGCSRPWRRVAILAACAAVFVGLTCYAAKDLFQVCDDEDAVSPMLAAYHSGAGFAGTDEYEPMGADNSLVATGLPAACLVSDKDTVLGAVAGGGPDDAVPAWDTSQHSCEATFVWAPNPGKAASEHIRVAAVTPHAGYLVLLLRSYPAWRVAVNGRPVDGLPQRDDGLMAVPVPQGSVEVTVDWTTTDDVIVGRWLSALALLLLTALWIAERKLSQSRLS